MKKFISIFIIITFILSFNSIIFAENKNLLPEDISSESAILIDAKNGDILFEKNIHKQIYPASTTKILTGILAIENGQMDKIIRVDDETPFKVKGSHIALEPGEELRFKELLNAMLIESANDASVVIAKEISGDVEHFSNLMNKKAEEIGTTNSNFVNPNGLHNESHVSSAYDLAMIAKYSMQNEQFKDIVKNYQYSINPTNKKSQIRNMQSSNKLLYSNKKITVDNQLVDIKYDGAIGVKTGYTQEAGNCVVSAVEKDGKTLISVVLKAVGNNLWVDTHNLMNYGFSKPISIKGESKNEFIENISVKNGNKEFIKGIITKNNSDLANDSLSDNTSRKIVINENLKAPIEKGQIIGQVEYIQDSNILNTENIISAEEISLVGSDNKKSLIFMLESTGVFWMILVSILFLIILRIRALKRKRKRRKRYRSK